MAWKKFLLQCRWADVAPQRLALRYDPVTKRLDVGTARRFVRMAEGLLACIRRGAHVERVGSVRRPWLRLRGVGGIEWAAGQERLVRYGYELQPVRGFRRMMR